MEMVTIPKEEYEMLKGQHNWVLALEAAGVDNWEGHDIAIDIMEARGQNV